MEFNKKSIAYNMANAFLACSILVVFILFLYREASCHDWEESFRDEMVVVERCRICGQQQFIVKDTGTYKNDVETNH